MGETQGNRAKNSTWLSLCTPHFKDTSFSLPTWMLLLTPAGLLCSLGYITVLQCPQDPINRGGVLWGHQMNKVYTWLWVSTWEETNLVEK